MEISIFLSLSQVTSQMAFGWNFVRGICAAVLDTVTVTNLYSVFLRLKDALCKQF